MSENTKGPSQLATHNFFGFLSFEVGNETFEESEIGFSVTAFGASLGLTGSDVSGNVSHNIFTSTGGLQAVDTDPGGNIISLAGVVGSVGSVLRQFYVPEVITSGTHFPTIGLAFNGSNLFYSAGLEGDTRIIETDMQGRLSKVIQTDPATPFGGLAWNGTMLLGMQFSGGCSLYAVDPASNSTTLVANVGICNVDGLGYDRSNKSLYLGSDGGSTVYQVNSTSGEMIRSFQTGFFRDGVEFDGRDVWTVDRNHVFHQFTTDGVEVFSFVGTDLFHEDLAFDPITFAPRCALWSVEAYAPTLDPETGMPANRITATEIPCAYGPAAHVLISAGPDGSVSYKFAGGSGNVAGGTVQAITAVLGNPLSLTAVPDSGSIFSLWSSTTGVDTTFGDQPIQRTSSTITPVITGNGMIIAKFSSQQATSNLLLNVNSSIITAGFSSQITATVLDQYGMPISDMLVDFSSTIGMLSSPSSLTDSLGHASVTLSPTGSPITAVAAVVSATASGLTAVKTVTFVPEQPGECSTRQSWKTCTALGITTRSMTIPQAIRQLPVIGGIGNALLSSGLNDYPINMYSLSPTCSTDMCQSSFTNNLGTLLGISVPTDYQATEVLILDIPLISILDNMMCYHVHVPFDGTINIGCLNIPTTNDGNPWAWGFDTTEVGITPYLRLTPSGSLNLALTLSRNAKAGSSIDVLKLVSNVASILIAMFKTDPKSKADALANALSNIASILAQAAASFDAKLSIITSDMSQIGSLSSTDVFDFDDFANAVSDALYAAATAIGIASREHLLKVAMDAAIAAGKALTGDIPVALLDAVEAGVDTLNYVLQYVVSQPPLSDNWVAQGIASAVGIVVSILDPSGSTIVPSYYNSRGQLILGYNVTSGETIFESSSGMLLASNNTYYAYVFGGGDVNVRMNTLGTEGVHVPYELEATNMTLGSAQTTYTGLVEVGNPLDVDLSRAGDGSIIPQLSVIPTVEVVGNRVLVIPFLTNGTKVAGKSAFVFVGPDTYEMSQVNATLFSLDLSPALRGSILFVYVVTGFTGGYGTAYLPAAPPFDYSLSNNGPLTIQSGSSGTVTITATLTSGTAQSIMLSCVTPLPSGVNCSSFTPSNLTPTFSSDLVITVASGTGTGEVKVQVTGMPAGTTTTATTVSVMISAAPAHVPPLILGLIQ